ncbi:hypothetical protein BGP79_12300 [Tersicoccus sp. Bi-70]|nr:hypothetical protein BGP79_12300 [Tersicoccus sp. Bi-70]
MVDRHGRRLVSPGRQPAAGGPGRSGTKASASVEDYVKAIHAHTEWHPGPITTTALAARLGVTAASASEMVRRLDERGLVVHRPYRPVELTPAGQTLAVAMIRRHRLLETWLATELGYGWDEVHDEAERLEHAVSDRLIEAIADRLGDPDQDPHGDPIPRGDGTLATVDARPLAGFDAGHPVLVRRVSDADPAALRQLAALGIGPLSELTVLTAADDAGQPGAGGRHLRVHRDTRAATAVHSGGRPGERIDGHNDERSGGPSRTTGTAETPLDGADVRLPAATVAAVWAVSRGEHDGCTLSPEPPGAGAIPAAEVPAATTPTGRTPAAQTPGSRPAAGRAAAVDRTGA